MATVTGLTAERMIEMENATIIDGAVVGNNLILYTKDGTQINAGNVQGPIGVAGASFIVCTSTTRPVLTAGEAGKAIYETDTKFIRVWTGTRWRLQEKIICTSTTRPTGLVTADEGVKIYETDSNQEFTWTGSAWVSMDFPLRVANTAARDAAIPTPTPGMMSYRIDTNRMEIYNGTTWVRTGMYGTLNGRTGCNIRRANAQTINSNTVEYIIWDTEDFDSDGLWSPGNPANFFVPTGLGGIWGFNLVIYNQTVPRQPDAFECMLIAGSTEIARGTTPGAGHFVMGNWSATTCGGINRMPSGQDLHAFIWYDDYGAVLNPIDIVAELNFWYLGP